MELDSGRIRANLRIIDLLKSLSFFLFISMITIVVGNGSDRSLVVCNILFGGGGISSNSVKTNIRECCIAGWWENMTVKLRW